MCKLPTILVSSVIRASQKGDSHGGIYQINLETEQIEQKIDWNTIEIDWEGRGGDRGLRGLTNYKNQLIAAASDEIFFFDINFKIVKSIRNPYLRYCHEIMIVKDKLYLSSTRFDSILVYDLIQEKFVESFYIKKIKKNRFIHFFSKKDFETDLICKIFDPKQKRGPKEKDTFHINNVHIKEENIYFSGTNLRYFYKIDKKRKISRIFHLPSGTHNVQYWNDFLVFNNTNNNCVSIYNKLGKEIQRNEIIEYPEDTLTNKTSSESIARQSFGRGLLLYNKFMIAGSSPATISVYEHGKSKPLKILTISKDIRTAIHGITFCEFKKIKKVSNSGDKV